MKDFLLVGVIAGISGAAITSALHKKGISVVLLIGCQGESGADLAEHLIVTDLSNKEFIFKELKRYGVTHIVMGTGHVVAIELAGYLESKQMVLSIDYQSSMLAKDKILYKKVLQSVGLSTPSFIQIEKYEDGTINEVLSKVSLPVVVKSSIDRILPQKCSTMQELQSALQEVLKTNSQALVEEFIDGVDCTIPYVSNYNNVSPVLFSYYSKSASCHLKGFGDAVEIRRFSREKEKQIEEYCIEAVKKTGIIGLCRIDAMIKGDQIYILECNSIIVTGVHTNQMDYGIHFLQKEGVDLAEILVDNALIIFQQKSINKQA